MHPRNVSGREGSLGKGQKGEKAVSAVGDAMGGKVQQTIVAHLVLNRRESGFVSRIEFRARNQLQQALTFFAGCRQRS